MSKFVQVVQSDNLPAQDRLVTAYLKLGWKLCGCAFVTMRGPAQTMIFDGSPVADADSGSYTMLSTKDSAGLVDLSNKYLVAGWVPYEGVFIMGEGLTQVLIMGSVGVYGKGGTSDIPPELLAQVQAASDAASNAQVAVANVLIAAQAAQTKADSAATKVSVDNLTTVVTAQGTKLTEHTGALLAKADLVAGKVPYSQLPEFPVGRKVNVANQAARLALGSYTDLTIAYQSDTGDAWGLDASADPAITANWSKLGNAQGIGVASFNGRTGNIGPQAGDYSADKITELTTKRFVSETQIAAWDGKATLANIDTKVAAQKTADDLVYATKASRGAANGYAPLGADSKVPAANLPAASAVDLSGLIPLTQKNAASGVAPLDADKRVALVNLPLFMPQSKRIWRNVKATRSVDQWITNDSGNEMEVFLRSAESTASSRFLSVNMRADANAASLIFRSFAFSVTSARWIHLSVTVPVGWMYQLSNFGGSTNALTETWAEMS